AHRPPRRRELAFHPPSATMPGGKGPRGTRPVLLSGGAMARKGRNPEDLDERDVPPVPLTRETLAEAWRLAGYLRPYRAIFLAGLLLLSINSLLSLPFPYLAGSLVDETLAALTRPDAPPPSWAQGIDASTLLLVGVVLTQGILGFLQSYGLTYVAESSLADLRRDAFGRLVRLPM